MFVMMAKGTAVLTHMGRVLKLVGPSMDLGAIVQARLGRARTETKFPHAASLGGGEGFEGSETSGLNLGDEDGFDTAHDCHASFGARG